MDGFPSPRCNVERQRFMVLGKLLKMNANEFSPWTVMITLDDITGIKPAEASSDGVFRINGISRKYGEMVRLRVVKDGYLPNPYTEDVTLGKIPPRIKLTRSK